MSQHPLDAVIVRLSALVDQARRELQLAEQRGVGQRRAEIRLRAFDEALRAVIPVHVQVAVVAQPFTRSELEDAAKLLWPDEQERPEIR